MKIYFNFFPITVLELWKTASYSKLFSPIMIRFQRETMRNFTFLNNSRSVALPATNKVTRSAENYLDFHLHTAKQGLLDNFYLYVAQLVDSNLSNYSRAKWPPLWLYLSVVISYGLSLQVTVCSFFGTRVFLTLDWFDKFDLTSKPKTRLRVSVMAHK